MENSCQNSKSLVLITRVGSTPTTGIRSSLESNDSGLLFLFQKMLHRNRLGTLYCHEGDWSWIYFFNVLLQLVFKKSTAFRLKIKSALFSY